MSKLTDCPDDLFKQIIEESFSYVEVEQKLGYKAYSGSVTQKIKNRVQVLGLDVSHFTAFQKVQRSPENIFIENSTAAQRTLRKYYYNGEYTPYVCSICGQLPEWQGKPLTLILDHINGKNHDDRLENLRWVCPNCNAQLDTFGSRNKAYKN